MPHIHVQDIFKTWKFQREFNSKACALQLWRLEFDSQHCLTHWVKFKALGIPNATAKCVMFSTLQQNKHCNKACVSITEKNVVNTILGEYHVYLQSCVWFLCHYKNRERRKINIIVNFFKDVNFRYCLFSRNKYLSQYFYEKKFRFEHFTSRLYLKNSEIKWVTANLLIDSYYLWRVFFR